jgi:hypothetical protein
MMTPKSLAYMIVAVFVGYMLVSAVPGQVAMYATPTLTGKGGEMVTVTGKGFSPENETLSLEIDDLSESTSDSVESDELHDLAESASEAVEAVAATAGPASEADAAEAAKAARDARSGIEFMGTMAWLIVNMFVALVVYWFARQRFA